MSTSHQPRWVLNDTLDDVSRFVRLGYWRLFQEAEKELAIAAGLMGPLVESMELHRQHCRKHPKDKAAAKRLAAIIIRHGDMEKNVAEPRTKFLAARKGYLEKVLDLMGFEHDLLRYVSIIDHDGSVRVGDSTSRAGFYHLLYADGAYYCILTS